MNVFSRTAFLLFCVLTVPVIAGAQTNGVWSLGSGQIGHAQVPDSESLSVTTAVFSASVWIKKESPTAMVGQRGYIFEKTIGGSVGASGGYALRYHADGTLGFTNALYFAVGDGSGSTVGAARGVAENAITDAAWHHVVCVYSAGVCQIYVDGVDVTTVNDRMNPGPIGDNTAPLFIGASALSPPSGGSFVGQMENLSIWNRALTAAEISTMHWCDLGGDELGLVGYWRFDQSPVPDASQNGNTATLVGSAVLEFESLPISACVVENRVWNLNAGQTGHAEAPDSESLSVTTTAFSASVWLKKESPTAMLGQRGYIFEKTPGSPGADGGYVLRYHADGTFGFTNALYFVVGDGSGSNVGAARGVAENAITDAAWHHVVCVYSAGVCQIYVDGVDVTTSNDRMNPGPIGDNTAPLLIGRSVHAPPNGGPFVGQMENLSIWDRALTFAEICSLDWRNLSGGESGLVAYWTFDEDPVPDASQNANTATLVGEAALVSESDVILSLATAIEVYFDSDFPTTAYQLQFATGPTYTNWTDLGDVVYGTGIEKSLFDGIRDVEHRIYRVVKP